MRDPGGALLALAKYSDRERRTNDEAAWCVLNTTDLAGAMANYGALFDWRFEAPVSLAAHGVFHPFAWTGGGQPVGAMSATAGRPNVHPHWLHFFPVAQLQHSLDAVLGAGGLALDPIALQEGHVMAVCEDPQGAAFGLYASAEGL